ncbi:hypothetical protein QUA76_25525, partial [Microcoleus sp. F8-A4]
SQKEEGKSQKAGARISVFTNMRCSLAFSLFIRSSCLFPFVRERDLSLLVSFACIILFVSDRADVPSLLPV